MIHVSHFLMCSSCRQRQATQRQEGQEEGEGQGQRQEARQTEGQVACTCGRCRAAVQDPQIRNSAGCAVVFACDQVYSCPWPLILKSSSACYLYIHESVAFLLHSVCTWAEWCVVIRSVAHPPGLPSEACCTLRAGTPKRQTIARRVGTGALRQPHGARPRHPRRAPSTTQDAAAHTMLFALAAASALSAARRCAPSSQQHGRAWLILRHVS